VRFAPLSARDLSLALAQAGQQPPDDGAALAHLAGGSVGAAIGLLHGGGVDLYAELTELAASLPRLDRPLALRLAAAAGGRDGDRFDLTLGLFDRLLARLARTGAVGAAPDDIVPGEAAILARLSPGPAAARAWADLAATLTAKARRGKAVNLDPAALVFDMFLECDRMAGRLPA